MHRIAAVWTVWTVICVRLADEEELIIIIISSSFFFGPLQCIENKFVKVLFNLMTKFHRTPFVFSIP